MAVRTTGQTPGVKPAHFDLEAMGLVDEVKTQIHKAITKPEKPHEFALQKEILKDYLKSGGQIDPYAEFANMTHHELAVKVTKLANKRSPIFQTLEDVTEHLMLFDVCPLKDIGQIQEKKSSLQQPPES